jgi:hypothetical protein
MVAHVRSSQAFALNLFGPLNKDRVATLLASIFDVEIATSELPAFEFVDAQDQLAERTPASDHATQVDVILRGTDSEGSRLALFIEVKLSEIDFSHCSAYQNPNNDAADICQGPGPFGGNVSHCFQLRNRGRHDRRRRYDSHLGPVECLPRHAGCLFRLGMNQPMRNVALARALRDADEVDRVGYALCGHDGNLSIWRRWREVQCVFGVDTSVVLAELPASVVVSLHAPHDAEWLRSRYNLKPPTDDK